VVGTVVQSPGEIAVFQRTAPLFIRSAPPRTYDVGPDGRFLMTESRANAASALSFVVVLNRFEELKARAPTK
jgi:hypothetical protein